MAPLDSRAEWHLSVKVRSTRAAAGSHSAPARPTEAEVELLDAEEGVSPGQACVFLRARGVARLWWRLGLARR